MTTEEIIEIHLEPEKTGVKPEQKKTEKELITVPSEGIPSGSLAQYPLSTTLNALTFYGIKGTSSMALLCAFATRLEVDLAEERATHKKSLEDVNTWKDRFYEEKEKKSVLLEKLGGAEKVKRLQNVLLTLGGLLGGVGARNLTAEFSGTSILLTLLGLCLLAIGWFWPDISSKEAKS